MLDRLLEQRMATANHAAEENEVLGAGNTDTCSNASNTEGTSLNKDYTYSLLGDSRRKRSVLQKLILDNYLTQRCKYWPSSGRHILAQYDDISIVVYQAFKPSIAKFAVEHQRFGGEDYSFSRMSWIKTSFLWMMYRCGWATKYKQDKVLAIRITRHAFDTILSNAYTAKFQKEENLRTHEIDVRLQWDPDHTPDFQRENRRAIQLGLKGETLKKFASDWIVSITDITDLAVQMKADYDKHGEKQLCTPQERLYIVRDLNTVNRIELSDPEDKNDKL